MSRYLPYEILNENIKLQTEQEKLDHLKKFANDGGFKEVMRLAFDKKVEWNLPEGEPPYRESTTPEGMGDTTIYYELRRLKNFIKGSPNEYNFSPLKKEAIFIGILEGLEKAEAKFLLSVKAKTIETDYPGFTKDILVKTFPDLNLD